MVCRAGHIRANRLNQTVLDSPHARLGLMASGKAYNDLRQALHDLGLDEEACRQIGLRGAQGGCGLALRSQCHTRVRNWAARDSGDRKSAR